jgi:hypothetical protein
MGGAALAAARGNSAADFELRVPPKLGIEHGQLTVRPRVSVKVIDRGASAKPAL